MRTFRAVAKQLVPRAGRRWARHLFGWRWFRGEYATWAEAAAHASGYDAPSIIERVLAATLAVRGGRAAYERDSVTFAEPAADAALLAALLRVHAALGGPLRVLDFGGALGSLYWRHRSWLPWDDGWRWDVVEQRAWVSAGRRHLADTPLRFFASVAEAEAAGGHDLLLCSTALQYLPEPCAALAEWRQHGWRFWLFNNLPLHRVGPDCIRVQHVPPSIYPASYPVWFFNRDKLLADLTRDHQLLAEFPSEAVWPVGWRDYPSTGLLLEKRKDR